MLYIFWNKKIEKYLDFFFNQLLNSLIVDTKTINKMSARD